jgi:glycosyltransferase involved in cell wall biosynthesis
MHKPLLSICIPTFNRPHYLREAITSFLTGQGSAVKKIEICVADNASNDDAEKVVSEFNGLVNVKYHRHESNIGLDANMFYVAGMASADYILWIGDDDAIAPGGLNKICAYIENDAPNFLLLNSDNRTPDMKRSLGLQINSKNDIRYSSPRDYFENHWDHMPNGAVVAKVDMLKKFDVQKFGGTFHLYSSYILWYLEEVFAHSGLVNVIVAAEPIMRIRAAEKTWKSSSLSIHFLGIPLWLDRTCRAKCEK